MIRQTIEAFYFYNDIRKRADHINRYSHDHMVDVKIDYDSNSATIIVKAKHADATPTLIPLDEDANRTLQHALDFGAKTDMIGKFNIENVPEGIFDTTSNIEFSNGVILPVSHDKPSIPIRIRFKSSDGITLYRINYLLLEPSQIGEKVGKWRGSFLSGLISITLAHNFESENGSWHIDSNTQNVKENNPKLFLEYFKFLESCSEAKYVQIELLKEDQVFQFDLPLVEYDKNNIPYISALKSLIYINKLLKLAIRVPPQLSVGEINHINIIASILRTGQTDVLSPEQLNKDNIVIGVEAPYKNVLDTFNSVKKRNEPIIIQWHEDSHAIVFGEKIVLGPYDMVLKDVVFTNEEEIKGNISQNSDQIKIMFHFNHETSFIQFPNWQPIDSVD